VTVLEDRLRSELRAESELITAESIAPLRLPGETGPMPFVARRRGPRQWPPWVIPLAAAAAAAAVIAGTFAAAHMLPASGPKPRPAGPKYTALPANYVYTVQGDIFHYVSHGTQYGASVTGRYLKVRSTATGKLLATVFPPKPYNSFTTITADATGTVFVLAVAHDWQRYANALPRVFRRNQTAPLRFVELHIDPAGRVQQSSLSLPITVTPQQQPSIALSPQGTRLAVAYGGGGAPAQVAVVSLGSGKVQRWVSPRVSWTPQLSYRGAWTADGRTLALQEWQVVRNRSLQAEMQWHPPNDHVGEPDRHPRAGSDPGRAQAPRAPAAGRRVPTRECFPHPRRRETDRRHRQERRCARARAMDRGTVGVLRADRSAAAAAGPVEVERRGPPARARRHPPRTDRLVQHLRQPAHPAVSGR
jgi:hypothetical protein